MSIEFTPFSSFHVCGECGALVYSIAQHEEWHQTFVKREIERIISGDDEELRKSPNPNFDLGQRFNWKESQANSDMFDEGDILVWIDGKGYEINPTSLDRSQEYVYDPFMDYVLGEQDIRFKRIKNSWVKEEEWPK